eukprot:CAMPEP_0184688398 /NCGR_PEP_ID=MMETSP0312-20130426/29737_1 /TAXON_ID=31354 /ORGANISM="Compsopogon coeruleus, Strain SAG 36.94" /LENGTH=77 /DNA_ID=CAMNT_0027145511 /DNA_START=42 /DNA_END=275 /DNA_ORIENTATION=+
MAAVVNEERQDVTFLYRFIPGVTDHSRGIHCARVARVPDEVCNRALSIAEEFARTMRDRVHRNRDINIIRDWIHQEP